MLLFLKEAFEKTWTIETRRVDPCYALIPNVAVIWAKSERALHFEWLSFSITFSVRLYTLENMGDFDE